MTEFYPLVGLVLMLLLFAVQGVAAEEGRVEAYECQQDGVPRFSDVPCGPDERRVGVAYEQPTADSVDAAQRRVEEAEAQSDRYRQQIELQRDIARSEGRISDLRKERDAKLLQLRSSLNNAEGRATRSIWNTGVREQMADVAVRYDSDIEAEQLKLDALLRREVDRRGP